MIASNRRRFLQLTAATLAAPALPRFAMAADWPAEKTIRAVVPFTAGSTIDILGRIMLDPVSRQIGQTIVVENRGGAGGTIGSDIAAKAAPDGYTLLVISLAHAVNPWLYKLPYDHDKAFVPIGSFGSGTNVLAVNPDLPVHSVKELIALAKAKPGELNYASAGVGSFQHLGGELFKLLAGVDIVHVPFRGGGPAMIDVMGGHTKIIFSSLIQTTPHVKSGQLRALATGGAKPNPVLPDVPTIGETVPGYEANNWWGMLAPAGTPPAIVEKLNKAVSTALDAPELQQQFAKEGASVVKMSPDEFGKYIVAETAKWGRVVKEGHITAK
jgi:tripartite-type tricarboxylate transporter receptor subunit TctC